MRTVFEEEVIDTQSADDQERIRNQMERILAHSSFRNSRRYQSFLRYVVEERLNGNSAYLKERLIGIAVFKQPLDYDTNANSVVRVTAGEVRRRLAQYYLHTSPSDEVMIELPLGSYVPEFRSNDITAAPEAALATPEPEVGLLYEAEEVAHPQVSMAVGLVTSPREGLWSRTTLAIVAGCGLIALAIAFAFAPHTFRLGEADRLWTGAFEGHDVLLCAGPMGVDQKTQPAQYANTGISYTIAKTLSIIGSGIGRTGGNAFLQPMQDTKLEDLQRSPAVLVGAFNNEWTMRLQAPLRYQFFQTPDSGRGIVDTKNSASKRFMVNDQPTRDYGILAHFHSPTTGQSTVIVGGLGTHGTAAVRIFLSSPELLQEFSKTAPRDWQKGNYEIVLASDLVNNLADSPKVVAVDFW